MSDPIQPAALSSIGQIRSAARQTGADFDYLMRTAERESAFDATAQAATSSAAGLFQFIEQTWFAMMARHGADHGYGEAARAIEQSDTGRYNVSDPAMRQQILDMRFDPQVASLMAGELASENAAYLEQSLGRRPDAGELYIAHFLGAGGAARLIKASEDMPMARAADLFPVAAQANRPVFYGTQGPRSVEDLVSNLKSHMREVQQARPASSSVPYRSASVNTPYEPNAYAASWTTRQPLPSGAVLSPALVELLASLDAPATSRSGPKK